MGETDGPLFPPVKCEMLGFPLDLSCGVWLEQSNYCRMVFCLARLPLFLLLMLERAGLCCGCLLLLVFILLVFLLPVAYGISWQLASSAPSLGYMTQNENPRNSSRVLPLFLRSSVVLPSPLHFAESSVYFVCCAQGVKLFLVGRIGKCTCTLSPPKQKSLYKFNCKFCSLACVSL